MRESIAAELIAADAARVWHPYGPMAGESVSAVGHQLPLLVESASGVRLRLADGRELIDGMSSWWAAIHGYRHPILDAAAHAQIDTMSHVMFGGLTHEPAVRLAQRLVEITPDPLEHVFFSDSGSVAVEVAAKMALQYWVSAGHMGKQKLLTWRGGYHGDTLHPMSVCDPDGGMHALWKGMLPEQVFVDAPPAGVNTAVDEKYCDEWEAVLAARHDQIAAIIVEPVVQGAGGMSFHNPAYLTRLRELADRYNVLLIFDEIATGFGRTGSLFAAEHARVSPDIMCLGKAMTGGYLSMAATLCTSAVARQISSGAVPVLAHGPTFMGNPLASAISLAAIDVLLSYDLPAEISRIEAGLLKGLGPIAQLDGVRDVRVFGAIGVIQLAADVDVGAATAAAVDRGVWLRPFRDLIYTMPPYIISDADLSTVSVAIHAAVEAGVRDSTA
ncbi:adenosylmethionine--8-amino-7-oxononanoate transaminase [Jatrophihabitans sp. DSM 45814]